MRRERIAGTGARGLGAGVRAIGLVLALALPACSVPPAAAPPVPALPGANVFVILVDTLRADRLSLYGYERPTSPVLDEFARDALVFEQSRSQAACTYPSVNSMFTSRAPQRFIAGGSMAIPAEEVTLAESFAASGYSTLAVSASPIVRATPGDHNDEGGFADGFQRFDESCTWNNARCVHRRFWEHLDQLQPPYFVYLHFLDPHAPYRIPHGHQRRFPSEVDVEDPDVKAGWPNKFARRISEGLVPGLSEAELAYFSDLYDEKISFWDHTFAELLDGLDERGLLEDSILLLTSDHGEAFLEHGELMHCRSLYDEELRVPTIWRVPGARTGRETALTQNLDVRPTLLELVGMAPIATDEGRSLARLIWGLEDGAGWRGPVHSWQFRMRSVVDERYKLMLNVDTGESLLFDRLHDPGETVDRWDRRRGQAEAMRELILEHVQEVEGRDAKNLKEAGDAVRDRLRRTGYLQ